MASWAILRNNAPRLFLLIAGAGAMAWCLAVFSTFSSETMIVDVAKAVAAGEAFKPEVLASIDAKMESYGDSAVRSSVLGKAALIRLRRTEDAIRSKDTKLIDRTRESLARIIDRAL